MKGMFFLFSALIATIAFGAWCEERASNAESKPGNIATTNSAANEAEIRKFLTEFAAAMGKNDVALLDKAWANDFTFVSHDGEIFTKPQLLELLKSGTEKFESLAFNDLSIRTYGDTAVVIAKGTQKAKLEGKDHSGTSVVSIVLVKNKDGWQMVLVHLAELKPISNKPSA